MKTGRRYFCAWGRILVLLSAVGLMGQARNCGNISQVMQELLDESFKGSSNDSKIYFSYLSLMDAETKSVTKTGDVGLINEAVLVIMQLLPAQDPKYVVNDPQNTLADNDANAQKLYAIYRDENMSRTEKVDKIVTDMMTPVNIDGLVGGFYHQKADGSINVRAFLISRSRKSMATETRTFTKAEFECKDPHGTKRVLCTKTKEDIKDAAVRMVRALIE